MNIDEMTWPSWSELLYKYQRDEQVRQLIFVQCKDGSEARLQLFAKTEEYPTIWTKLLSCPAYIGQRGLGKEREGDRKTPLGDFGVVTAFGVKDDPGAKLPYIKADEHIYTADGPYYNRLVDDRQEPLEKILQYEGELLMEVSPQFNYGLHIDYNHACDPAKGSFIFLHCTGANDFTMGCVAVEEPEMKFILQHVDKDVRICIYPYTSKI